MTTSRRTRRRILLYLPQGSSSQRLRNRTSPHVLAGLGIVVLICLVAPICLLAAGFSPECAGVTLACGALLSVPLVVPLAVLDPPEDDF
jgi:peptidoglycan/LPS O-acetylase OafA/YrhL